MRSPVCKGLVNSQALYLLVSKRSAWMGKAKKAPWSTVNGAEP